MRPFYTTLGKPSVRLSLAAQKTRPWSPHHSPLLQQFDWLNRSLRKRQSRALALAHHRSALRFNDLNLFIDVCGTTSGMSRRAQKSLDFWFYSHDVMLPIAAMRCYWVVLAVAICSQPLSTGSIDWLSSTTDLGLDLMRWFSQDQIGAQ